jgi:hypothetical protein
MPKSASPRRETREKAAAGGRRRFLGAPCSSCRKRLRYTSSGSCVACSLERSRARYAKLMAALQAAEGTP